METTGNAAQTAQRGVQNHQVPAVGTLVSAWSSQHRLVLGQVKVTVRKSLDWVDSYALCRIPSCQTIK
ncbi:MULTISPECIES: hypothetical protein [Scytonema]